MKITVARSFERAQQASRRAKRASAMARADNSIDAHRVAIEKHRVANILWTRAHRVSIDADTPKVTQRMTYNRYVAHYDAIRRHWQRCWDLGTRLGLSFPKGAPCGRTSDYLLER